MATLGGGHRLLLEVSMLRSFCPAFGGMWKEGAALSPRLSPGKGAPLQTLRDCP